MWSKKEAVFDELEVSGQKEDMLQYLGDRAELAMEGLTVISGEAFAVQVMDGSVPLAAFRLQAYLDGEPVPCDWGVLERLDRE